MEFMEHTVLLKILRFRKGNRTFDPPTSLVEIPIFSWCRNCTG